MTVDAYLLSDPSSCARYTEEDGPVLTTVDDTQWIDDPLSPFRKADEDVPVPKTGAVATIIANNSRDYSQKSDKFIIKIRRLAAFLLFSSICIL